MSGLSSVALLAFGFGPMEILAVTLVVLLLFGNRVPSVMRSLGVGITEFKKGIRGDGITDPDATIEDKRHENR
ncbi:MAG TPA: twin-arginine translocase TatA/TatE family subunit [Lacipirellulaceae bacterium]|nr:twin-arginine translocase TatA/TatE family subunit [Lacipirellulaceae bacterium]